MTSVGGFFIVEFDLRPQLLSSAASPTVLPKSLAKHGIKAVSLHRSSEIWVRLMLRVRARSLLIKISHGRRRRMGEEANAR
jgi:hypothetical protein